MKRVEQIENRRRAIIETALNLFIRKGYAATRTADIAREAGMSEGLLFHYFETKEKLYLSLLEIAAQGKDNVFNAPASSPVEFFEATAQTVLDYVAREPFAAELFVLMGRAQYDEGVPNFAKSFSMRRKDVECAVALIEKGQQDGSIRKGDPLALATAFFTAIQGIAENIARNPQMPVPRAEWITDIIRGKQ